MKNKEKDEKAIEEKRKRSSLWGKMPKRDLRRWERQGNSGKRDGEDKGWRTGEFSADKRESKTKEG